MGEWVSGRTDGRPGAWMVGVLPLTCLCRLPQIRKRRDRNIPELRINVRRQRVFEDSFHQFRARAAEELKGKLVVSFDREEGIDAGTILGES